MFILQKQGKREIVYLIVRTSFQTRAPRSEDLLLGGEGGDSRIKQELI